MRLIIVFLFTVLSAISSISIAQVSTFYVKPADVDAGYGSNEDSSAISITTGTRLNKLFLWIGGTKSSSSKDYNAVRLYSASLGFDFINLSYLNDVAANSLKDDLDTLAFREYRQELCYGTQISSDVDVDSFNSIYTRALKLLQYLDNNRPGENWGQHLSSSNTIEWSKVIIGGHSQGSGHAAYLARKNAVERVLMFSGPNDYSDHFSKPAEWLAKSGVTPIGSHFSYLSLNDEAVPYFKQFANISAMGMLASDDSTYVDDADAPFGYSNCLYTTQLPGIVLINHNSPVKNTAKNKEVWEYMLTGRTASVRGNQSKLSTTIYPNPATSVIHVKSINSLLGKSYELLNLTGHTILTGEIASANTFTIDISAIQEGIYILRVASNAARVVKTH